jgi:ketosteroid isomerase-like protein
MSNHVAERFVRAIAEHDRTALEALLAPDIDFRGLTPGRSWEAATPPDVVDVVLGHWFEDTDRIEAVTRIEHGDDVADVQRVGYRFDVSNDAGPQTVEQQAYYRVSDGRLSYVRVVCSGFRPRSSPVIQA